MKEINYIDLFNRHEEKKKVLDFLTHFSTDDLNTTKGLYILGPPGCGKTSFIKDIIPPEEYDIITYDAGDVRTKTVIPDMLGNNNANVNIMDLFLKKRKKIVILLDEMDYMNSGDKGGVKELVKYVRQKKTKKQYSEPYSKRPVIFIGTNDNDKKFKELISACELVQLSKPTDSQILSYITYMMPTINIHKYGSKFLDYVNGNLKKLDFFIDIYKEKELGNIDNIGNIDDVFETLNDKYSHNNYSKTIISKLYKSYIPIKDYDSIIKETDRTTLGLLWHENLIPIINTKNDASLYKVILDDLCFSDNIDRIIFQNQIWQLSEINSFIKTFYNNYNLHTKLKEINIPEEIEFTKVLTKYSTEYNNFCFFQHLEQKIFMDKEAILHLFYTKTDEELMDKYYFTTLDIDRMRRFIKNGNFFIK